MDNITKQLNNLKSITPDQTWLESNREKLMAQIDFDEPAFANRFFSKFKISWQHVVYAPIKVVAIVMLLAIGLSTSFMAKASLPGDILYPGRIIIEKVELVLASSPAEEAAIHAKHAQQRLADLRAMQNNSTEQDISTTAKRLEKDLTAAAASLDIAQSENDTDTDEIAAQLSGSAAAATQALDEAKQVTLSAETLVTLSDVIKTSVSVEDRALSALVRMYEDDKLTTSEMADKFITIIDDQLLTLTEQVESLQNELTALDQADIDKQEVDIVYQTMRQAGSDLEVAKQFISSSEYSKAFSTLSSVKSDIYDVQESIAKWQQAINAEKDLEESENVPKKEE